MEETSIEISPQSKGDLSVSIVIVTRNRPEAVQMCLGHLERLETRPLEIIVVDGSDDEDTRSVVGNFPDVQYVFVPDGANKMCTERNIGIQRAQGDIVALIDDDSIVRPDWLAWLVAGYDAPGVGGVGGMIIDEYEMSRERVDDPRIGVFTREGYMTANFGLDSGRKVEVDHLRGCNMSFRREVLLQVGGFDPIYNRLSVLDDTDVCLRVKSAGYQLYFEPRAVVDHLSLRWKSYSDTRSFGLRHWFIGALLYAYLIFKNIGVGWPQLCHVFGGLFLLRWRVYWQSRRKDDWQRAVTLWPGSLAGLVAALRRRGMPSHYE